MALISCPECKKEISDLSAACPHCGYPIVGNQVHSVEQSKTIPVQKHKSKKLILIITIVLVGIFAFYFFISSNFSKPNEYELHAISAVKDMKMYLKNPDSLNIYEAQFYKQFGDGAGDFDSEYKPLLVVRYSAQNGFGGNTASYAIFGIAKDKTEYELYGDCNTLQEDEIDDFGDKLIAIMINTIAKEENKVGSINVDKLNKLLAN